jgi:hypothetical protein
VAGGTWDPSPKNLADAATTLQPYVTQQASLQHQKLPEWSTYSFQYQGREVNGHQLVYVNAFCTPPPVNAKENLVVVFDGGPCYFSAYYDPRTKKFVAINFNGFA